MQDPYEILGLSPQADDAQLREAYRRLARENEGNLRRMEKLNEAYDSIVLARGESCGGTRSGTAWEKTAPPPPGFADIRQRLQAGRYDDALTLLDGVPLPQRGAQWHYFKGLAQRGKGWLEEAEKHLCEAARLAPENAEYQATYQNLRQSRQGGYRARRAAAEKEDDSGCCGLCLGLCCLDSCCECCGGDLIPCC
ncbi:MAG: J domain-containing protein [Oscillospiraceae bacterium]|nr:J domain-containing protein [Oscillospiraceae bacterium]